MRYEEKKKRLTDLAEVDFRSQVVIPLFRALGYSDVHEFHGPIEKGKDILFREPSKLGESFTHAIIASTQDISGKVGNSKSAARILEQAEMVFNEEYKDKYTGKTNNVDRCWVLTTGTISPHAIESISGKLEKYNLNRLIRFIDIDKLIELIDQNYPQFWERKEQFAYFSRYEKIDISTNDLDFPFDKEVDDLSAAGNLKDTVYRIKILANSILSDLDYDFRDKLAVVLKTNHPWEIISIWEELYGEIDSNGHLYIGRKPSEIQTEWEYLLQDLQEYEERFDIRKNDRHTKESSE